MKHLNQDTVANGINRRAMLAGTAATAVVISSLPTSVFAMPTGLSNPFVPIKHYGNGNTTLANYLCDSAHGQIAKKLDEIIADPKVDGERTALALMEARCPGCGGRVDPETSSLSAVVPKWKTPDINRTQTIV
jgi:hypothetical protein